MARSLVTNSGALRPDAVRDAAQLFTRGELVLAHVPGEGLEGAQRARAAIYTGDDVVYTVPEAKRLSLSLSKNIIIHLFVDVALVSTALLVAPGPPVAAPVLRERVRYLSRLFKHEFMFRADASFDRIFDTTIDAMVAAGELTRMGDELAVGPGHDGVSGRGWTCFYADVLRPFLLGYRVAARTVAVLAKGPLTSKELVKRALVTGDRMYLSGEIARREAVSRPILENALLALTDQQYLSSGDGKLSLSPSFASADAAKTVEARIGSLVPDDVSAPLAGEDG